MTILCPCNLWILDSKDIQETVQGFNTILINTSIHLDPGSWANQAVENSAA